MGGTGLDVEIVGAGRNLVLLHSLLSDRRSYRALAGRLAGERRLILVNMPGFGASPAGAAPVDGYADAIANLFDDLALPRDTDIVGNGLGGFVALSLAIRHGERFDRAVLIGGAVAFPEAGRATFRALAEKAERDGMAALADTAVRRMFADAYVATHPEVAAELKSVFAGLDPRVFAAAARALAALDFGPDLGRIANPVLVVAGELDGATPPALGRELARRIPGAAMIELPGLGHCPHIQDADAVIRAVSPFLGLRAAAEGTAGAVQ